MNFQLCLFCLRDHFDYFDLMKLISLKVCSRWWKRSQRKQYLHSSKVKEPKPTIDSLTLCFWAGGNFSCPVCSWEEFSKCISILMQTYNICGELYINSKLSNHKLKSKLKLRLFVYWNIYMQSLKILKRHFSTHNFRKIPLPYVGDKLLIWKGSKYHYKVVQQIEK